MNVKIIRYKNILKDQENFSMAIIQRSIIFAIVGLALSINALCQGSGSTIKNIPYKYLKPHYNGDPDTTATTDFVWVVFSDRDQNPTYTEPNGNKVMMTLNFLDYFYVLDQQNEFLHIFKDDKFAAIEKKLGSNAVDYGWISEKNVLLWKRSLLNDQNVSKKVMLLNTVEFAGDKIEPGQIRKVKFYSDPGLHTLANYESNIYEIFYVYKVEGPLQKPKAVLLGTKFRFDGYSDRKNIQGWVDAKRLAMWDHRVAALPNTEDNALTERKNNNIKATIFPAKGSAVKYRDMQPLDQNDLRIWASDSCLRLDQYKSSYDRFPILSNEKTIENDKNVFQIGAIGDVRSVSGKKINAFDFADTKEKINIGRANSRNVNIVFVIDGTQSMQPYFNSVSEAIIESMKTLSADNVNIFKFAAVVYRDQSEGNDQRVEIKNINSDYHEIATWLRNRKAFSSANDPDFGEAMNYGLKTGLRRISLPPKESNFVILIGDAGDHGRQNDPTTTPVVDIIDLLFQYKCNFISFQVNNPGSKDYINFISQSRHILSQLAGRYYQDNIPTAKALGIQASPPELSKPIPYKDNLRINVIHSPFRTGFIMPTPLGKVLSSSTLKDETTNAIYALNDSTNSKIDKTQSLLERGGVDNIDEGLLTYLTSLGIPPENLNLLADEHAQLYFVGFTSKTVKNARYPVWQFDLLYSNEELQKIVQYVNLLSEEANKDNYQLREAFYIAWIEILKSHIGSTKLNKEIEDMKIGEIEALVFGAVGTTPLLQHSLKEIKDKAIISDIELHKWLFEIDKKKQKLNNIANMTSDAKIYSFTSHDDRFFWIPQKLLP